MKITPALALSDIARSHRLGKMREGAGNRRAIIVRFNSDRVRDCVYRGFVNLKGYNSQHRDNPGFINDDLTARRSKLAFECRQLKKAKKISDTCVAPLNVKTTLNVKTAKSEKPNNR